MTKHIIVLIAACLFFFSLSASVAGAGGEILSNESVIKMVNAKIGDALIIRKIGASRNDFDLSTDAIIRLKQEGVSDQVIEAMMNAGEEKGEGRQTVKKSLAPPSFLHGRSVQVNVLLNSGIRVPIPYSKAGSEYSAGRGFFDPTLAASGSSLMYAIAGDRSETRFEETKPSFVVSVQTDPSQHIETKDDELILAHLEAKKGMRYIAFSATGVRRVISGTKQSVEVVFEKTEDGSFKLTPKEPLSPGEYALILKTDSGIDVRFYDFGIDEQEKNTSSQEIMKESGQKKGSSHYMEKIGE